MMATVPKRVTLNDLSSDPAGIFEHVVNDDATVIVEDENGAEVELRLLHARPHDAERRSLPAPTAEEIERSRAGIRAAAGRWKGLVDVEAFKAYLAERRTIRRRPPERL